MNLIKMYCDFVIKPIEEEVKMLRSKVYSKNFFDWISRDLYKLYLQKNEKLLFDSYQKLGEMIDEELAFHGKFD